MAASDLFYLALEPEQRAFAVRQQVESAFRPYRVFLEQALKGAEERQATAVVRWCPANARRFRLQATTTDVVLERDAGWVVEGLPPEESLDLDEEFYRPSDRRYFRPERLARSDGQVRVAFGDDGPEPGDRLKWKGLSVTLVADGGEEPPESLVVRGHREPVHAVRSEEDEEGELRVRVDGLHREGDVVGPTGWRVRSVQPTEPAGNRVVDETESCFDLLDGGFVASNRSQPVGRVRDARGIPFDCVDAEAGRRQGKGNWIRLELDEEQDRDSGVDPRMAFFDSEENEIWAISREDTSRNRIGKPRGPARILKVRDRDRERFELLVERLPPEDQELLCLPLDTWQLKIRQAVVYRIQEAPLEHHRPLMRLFESPDKVYLPFPAAAPEPEWRVLSSVDRDGTEQQRSFVKKALATPDFAVLEGPPGSGKTTAICELVLQCIARGQRVMLCATTNYAIDNVLERLADEEKYPEVFALRIGRAERIDEKLERFRYEARVEALEQRLRAGKPLPADVDVAAAASKLVLDAANLVCGTTIGILAHPWLKVPAGELRQHLRLGQPLFDVLIVDEASKTTVPEFLVPAALAGRWIIVGDKRQLSPFADRAELVANLAQAQLDESGGGTSLTPKRIPDALQRACHFLFELGRLDECGARWLVVEPDSVIDALWREATTPPPMPVEPSSAPRPASPLRRGPQGLVVRIVDRADGRRDGTRFRQVEVADLEQGDPRALAVPAASVVLVPSHLFQQVWRHLPPEACLVRRLDNLPKPFEFRHAALRQGPIARSPRGAHGKLSELPALEAHAVRRLSETSWAGELAWRLIRRHELRSRPGKDDHLGREIAQLEPATVRLGQAIESVQQIALPSIIESLQEGVRSSLERRSSLLGTGFESNDASERMKQAWKMRFEPLTYQHRMHPDIAAFPRERFYEGTRLADANTISLRDEGLGWVPAWTEPPPGRSCWLDVEGREERGRNLQEVEAIRVKLREFLAWAAHHPPNRPDEPRWQVAVLSFYLGQQEALAEMLRDETRSDKRLRFERPNVDLVCGTVDRFQGREADLVFLSFRNTGRKGFLDSVNRLNVGITRARQQLVLVGNRRYWQSDRHGVEELTALGGQPSWQVSVVGGRGGRR